MSARQERASGAINALLLLLFLSGAAVLLFRENILVPSSLLSGNALIIVMGIVLCMELLLCMSPLSLPAQPLCMPVLGAASFCEAEAILQATVFQVIAVRLLLLFLLVSLCFLIGGRGIWNALLLTRTIRADRDGLGSSVKTSCVLAIFGFAALCLLGRILRYV